MRFLDGLPVTAAWNNTTAGSMQADVGGPVGAEVRRDLAGLDITGGISG